MGTETENARLLADVARLRELLKGALPYIESYAEGTQTGEPCPASKDAAAIRAALAETDRLK